jgi:hypothetical protein
MRRRWTMGALLAVVVAIFSAVSVSGGLASDRPWSLTLHLAPLTVELNPSAQTVRIDISF